MENVKKLSVYPCDKNIRRFELTRQVLRVMNDTGAQIEKAGCQGLCYGIATLCQQSPFFLVSEEEPQEGVRPRGKLVHGKDLEQLTESLRQQTGLDISEALKQ